MTKFNKIIRKKTEKQLITEFISLFKSLVAKKEKLNQRFKFVLTGGSSPINLYKSLSKTKINWNNLDLFWTDERYVSFKSNNSNFKMVKRFLINKINIKKKNIFFIDTLKKSAESSASDYAKKIKKNFINKQISFDLILLGMGTDGHIAYIFPNSLSLKSKKIVSVISRKDFKRITLNLRIINKAKKIFLWLNNKKKSSIYNNIKKNKKKPVNLLMKNKTLLFLINKKKF